VATVPDAAVWLAALERDHANLRAAAGMMDTERRSVGLRL